MRTCPHWSSSPSRHTADVDTYRPTAAVVRGSGRAAGSGKEQCFAQRFVTLWIGTPPALSFAEVNKNNVSEWRRSHLFRTHGFRRGSAALRPHPVGRAERHLQGALERPSRHEPVLRLSYASYVGEPRVLEKRPALRVDSPCGKRPKMLSNPGRYPISASCFAKCSASIRGARRRLLYRKFDRTQLSTHR